MTSGFGALLRELRRQAGMTQDELADRSGVAVRTIRRLEREVGTNPRLGTVKLLADALGIAPEDHRRLLTVTAGGTAVPAEGIAVPGGESAGGAMVLGEGMPVPGGLVSEAAAPGEVAGGAAVPAEGIPVPGDLGPGATAGGSAVPGDVVPGVAAQGKAAGGVAVSGEGAPRTTPRGELAAAAEGLAHAVAGRWQREEEQRRIHDPFPLPVRWRPLPARLTDHWANIRRVPAGATADPLDLAGELGEIAATYRRIPSGRLVILGRAGSGKTVLTLRFVLDRLRDRADTEPVPVLLGLGSWDPGAAALRDWLIDALLRDYPGLAAAAPGGGSTLAAALVEAGHVLPVLDGFDEIADGLHRAALEALNGTTLPLVLTSRPAEYAAAVAATDVLTAAAGIELTDLTPGDVLAYLPRTTRRPAPDGAPGTVWDPVLAESGSEAGAALAAVLSTPLMVVLARTVYSDAPGEDPAVLLDTTRFPTAEAVEDHLLGSFVPTVYRDRPRWDPGRARRWLGYLARHLDRLGTRDLAWWRLGGSLPRSSRILAVVLSAMLATAVADWLFFVPVDVVTMGFLPGLGAGLLDGLLVGAVVGLAFGLVHGIMVVYGGLVFEPSRLQVRLRGRTGRPEGSLLRRYAGRFVAGLLGGFVVGLGYGPVTVISRAMATGFTPGIGVLVETALVNTLASGLVFGLAAGATFGLVSVLETPLDISSAAGPAMLLRANRTTVLRQVLAFGPLLALAIAAGGRIVVELLQGVLGPLVWTLSGGLIVGAVGGLGGAVAYVFAFTAWGQWLVVSRVWLPLTGRLPWATAAFLEDAYRRGILRQAGAFYQFRHARLQDHLARTESP
ncbi:helix-turn-helix domain-containing protein [Amycolatopsis sp. NPDC051045]|uniref:helix-turn-helix domain-containing protein n=1 Tax=Amycolatopsis sp. NPDC051045 TaxID=3156922 RepID=UPI00341648FD